MAFCCVGVLWPTNATAETILIVDDDDDNPNVQAHFTAGLAQLGIPYDVYVVGTGTEEGPTAEILAEHPMVIWFSGAKVAANPYPYGDPAAGPSVNDEALLADWLDAGGRLWMDSQSYIEDYTYIRPFLVDHIGVQLGVFLWSEVQTLYGEGGDPIGGMFTGGVGTDYTYTAISTPLAVPQSLGEPVFNIGGGQYGAPNYAVSYRGESAGDRWRFFYNSVAWDALAEEDPFDAADVMEEILEWLICDSDDDEAWGPQCGGNDCEDEIRDMVDNDCDGVADDGVIDAGEIVITEIMKDPDEVQDTVGEWFEIYNPSAMDINLEGWVISDDLSDNHAIQGQLIIPAGGYLVLGIEDDSAVNGGVTVDYEYNGRILREGAFRTSHHAAESQV